MTEFHHECKSFEQDDGSVVVECLCGWGVTLEGWEGHDENGRKIGRKPAKFVESFTNAHKLSQLQWPYPDHIASKPDTWPGT